MLPVARIETISTPFDDHGSPEVERVAFDLWELRITLRFVTPTVYVVFPDVNGFRVLDEGDLLEFWSPEPRASGWLWRIIDGGWIAQERQRSGFVGYQGMSEYLICGVDFCAGERRKRS